jgi:AcrR family transcriptional regulator
MGIKQRRRREKEERRRQILSAARTLLYKKGLGAISVSQIAREAEIAVGTIYFYFRSKEHIFAALQEEGLTLLQQTVRRALEAGADPAHQLHKIAQAYLHFCREHKRYFDVINHFLSAPEVIFAPPIKQQVDQHGERILKMVQAVLQEGVSQGHFRPIDVRRHALLFWAVLHGLVPFQKMQDTLLADDSFAALYGFAVEHFIHGLLPRPPLSPAPDSGTS